MILETVATFASTLVDEVAVIGFWRQCISQQDDTSGTHAYLESCGNVPTTAITI